MNLPFLKQTPETVTIFLDVDGVLNCESDWQTPFSINDGCVKNLASADRLLKKKGCIPSYVLCSTWRSGKGTDGKNAPQYDMLINALKKYGIPISGQTPQSSNKTRQEEIEYYARRNNITNWIAIDDDGNLYPRKSEIRLIEPDYRKGFSEKDIKTVAKLATA